MLHVDPRRRLSIHLVEAKLESQAESSDLLKVAIRSKATGEVAYLESPVKREHAGWCLARATALSKGLKPGHEQMCRLVDIENLFKVAKHPRDISQMRLWPFSHQVDDVEAMLEHPYFFVASEMRTGKTKIVIDAAQFLFEANVIDKVIVVTPSPVRDVWYDPTLGELVKHLWARTPARVTEYYSTLRTWSNSILASKMEWLITNYEFVASKMRLVQLLPFAGPRTLLVLDESSYVKGHDSARTKACLQLRRRCGRVVLMNGTPISQGPLDLFSQGNILHPSILDCPYVTVFKSRYAVQEPLRGEGGAVKLSKRGQPIMLAKSWTNLPDLVERFSSCTVRRLQADCLDLPPKLDPVTMTVPLSNALWKSYRGMRDQMVVWLKTSEVAMARSAAIKSMRLSQLTSGFLGGVEPSGIDFESDELPGFLEAMIEAEAPGAKPVNEKLKDYETASLREVGREKLDLLLWFLEQRLAEDPKFKVVVWVHFRAELYRMIEVVAAKFPGITMAKIHGGQGTKEGRADRLRALALLKPETTPDEPIFVGGTFGTGSYGLDMTAAHTSVALSYDASLGKFLQSADRVVGPEQTEPIAYYDFVATGPKGQKTIDHALIAARRANQSVADWSVSHWVKVLEEE